MRRIIIAAAALLLAVPAAVHAQDQYVGEAKFSLGDDPAWSAPAFDDSAWRTLSLDRDWEEQGIRHYSAYAWYRLKVVIPSSLRKGVTDRILLDLGPIDDTDETFFNGKLVGKTGSNPGDPDGYIGMWSVKRRYLVDPKQVKWDKENVIAVRVYNSGGPGGFRGGPAHVGKPVLSDFVRVSMVRDGDGCKMSIASDIKTTGTVEMALVDLATEQSSKPEVTKVSLVPGKEAVLSWKPEGLVKVVATYKDDRFGESLGASYNVPYILTPPAPAAPRYNGPKVFGVRPGSPVIFRLAFSGDKPMKYSVEGLPEGVELDPDKGVLGGSVKTAGDYPLVFTATNAKGTAKAEFTLKVGDKIALTPPMGWNSWNCWGLSVSQEKVMSSARALIDRGLADYGYCYMNIDDAWEADKRNPDGTIATNDKFPDMQALGDWLHSNGLKMGIYSSPGDLTCGGYLGSIDHERQDAETWSSWGVDYLKYDWCGYGKVFDAQDDKSTASYVRPYLKMQEYLRQQPRDIFYSLCQYGMADVWTWGHVVDANSWRTTGDITDTWASLHDIGFQRQVGLHPYAGPGHWNDPDMLVVGKVGWSDNLRDSRLTPDEQYTHISLWSLLAANMLIGCDIAQMDDFTFNLLCNNEVNAVNQDVQGVQAHRDYVQDDGIQVWSRNLSDGGLAIGIFNVADHPREVELSDVFEKMGVQYVGKIRDLWRQQDIPKGKYRIFSHGVLYIKVTPGHPWFVTPY